MAVPNTFSSATGNIPLSQLDANFATPLTIGNTAAQLGNVVTTLNNITLANATVTSLFTPLAVTAGGTGSNATTYCSLTSNVTGTLPVANGGTGATSLASNNVLLGNGTSAVQVVAPGNSGNVLTSNGTTWTSVAGPTTGLTLLATLSASGVNSISALGLSQYESFLIVSDSVALASASSLRFSLSSNNGSSYGSNFTFTNTDTTVLGMVQIYRCKTASTSKPCSINNFNSSSYAIYTSTTGIINAININTTGSVNINSGIIYIYGQG